MNIDVLFNDESHPAYKYFFGWCLDNKAFIFNDKSELKGGDILFLISCTQILKKERDLYKQVFVIHESDVPNGRGWSPLAWQILEGKNEIIISLMEAGDSVDSGDVFSKETLFLDGTELNDEIHQKCAAVKIELMKKAVSHEINRVKQEGYASYYPRRTPEDSRLSITDSLESQFDLLRICDPRFPAFFEHRGCKYEVSIRKA